MFFLLRESDVNLIEQHCPVYLLKVNIQKMCNCEIIGNIHISKQDGLNTDVARSDLSTPVQPSKHYVVTFMLWALHPLGKYTNQIVGSAVHSVGRT